MFEQFQICPYTGLRSFTEEESLYFKGREDHIEQATEQLQRNKFLMLTGASGDGKSSLVYAGIIPNARAGFLKSKYTQWCVADFRPERSPFRNLCKSVARQLEIPNVHIVESELQHGFSALADLYRNSKRFVDVESLAWKEADDRGKAALKREAANLIILVDQFEEFFTNPENYRHGAPSGDANLVLNLLLETSRIALEEDLPIYIIFTMRSDFIGQCASFRGLPEYIGFSQFFVPRLNRSQLQQVVEEPAVLSGNRITRRLTERLIHDITDGVDQLPILQHALNQIWVAASNGTEEMDLIHYAMVGGMSVNELPDEQVGRFSSWFEGQPQEIKEFYREPNLQNVLDTHTNKLYEQAADYYEGKTGKAISEADAKAIIKNAFTCLTKIDQSRAVRNRMTLQEITHILGNLEYDATTVGEVLNIFREPGNTFIRPFITDEEESQVVAPGQVLDITHESLIRNWEYLEKWAKEEFDSYSVSLDFGKQLNRWVKSSKSDAHLFSIGPLTYFENWFDRVKPNVWWIARYLPEEIEQERKLSKANRILGNSEEFLRRSARKHVITRTIMRYGPKRIAAVVGLVLILALSAFTLNTYLRQQNSAVLKSIHQETLRLANSRKAALDTRAALILEEIKLGQTTLDEIAAAVSDPIEKINVINSVSTLLIVQGYSEPKSEIFRSITLVDSLLGAYAPEGKNGQQMGAFLTEANDFRMALDLSYFHTADKQIDEWRKKNAGRSGKWVLRILTTQPADYTDIQSLGLGLEDAINTHSFSDEELRKIALILSPFENKSSSDWLKKNFRKDNFLSRGSLNYGFDFNALYQFLASVYAAEGNSEQALQCMDSLIRYGQSNFLGKYETGLDNATNIAAVYFLNGRTSSLDAFVKGYCAKAGSNEEAFYSQLLGRTLHSGTSTSFLSLYDFMDVDVNPNLQFCGKQLLTFFFGKHRDAILVEKDINKRNFLLALSYKNEGIEKHINAEKEPGEWTSSQYFDKALEYYNKVDVRYLQEGISIIGAAGSSEDSKAPRKFLFTYPDIKTEFHPLEPRSFFFFYSTDVFMDYILDHELFSTFYPTSADMDNITAWMRYYNSKIWAPTLFLVSPMRQEVMARLEGTVASATVKGGDMNYLYLHVGHEAQKRNDEKQALYAYRKLDQSKIGNSLRSKEFANFINDYTFQLVSDGVKAFARSGHFDEAYRLVHAFKNPINRSSLYADVASDLILEKYEGPLIQQLIDSSRIEIGRIKNLMTGQPNRELLALAMCLQNPGKNSAEAYRLIKNLQTKSSAIAGICLSYSYHGMLHSAVSNIPANISDLDQADYLSFILDGYGKTMPVHEEWKIFDSHYLPPRGNQVYVDEDN